MMPPEVHVEAQSWIRAVEIAAARKAGAPLEGLAAEAAEGLGIYLMFAARLRAKHATVPGAHEILMEFVRPLAYVAGLSPEEALRVRPAGIA